MKLSMSLSREFHRMFRASQTSSHFAKEAKKDNLYHFAKPCIRHLTSSARRDCPAGRNLSQTPQPSPDIRSRSSAVDSELAEVAAVAQSFLDSWEAEGARQTVDKM